MCEICIYFFIDRSGGLYWISPLGIIIIYQVLKNTNGKGGGWKIWQNCVFTIITAVSEKDILFFYKEIKLPNILFLRPVVLNLFLFVAPLGVLWKSRGTLYTSALYNCYNMYGYIFNNLAAHRRPVRGPLVENHCFRRYTTD